MDADWDLTWRFAVLCQRVNHLAAFVAACTDDPERAREARQLAERAFASDHTNLYEIGLIVQELDKWAKVLADHPHRPAPVRPDEVDRQARDHVKDLLRDRWSANDRDEWSRLQLSLDVTFNAVRRRSVDACAREDASFAYGRTTMALDLGQYHVARRELLRLEELKQSAEERRDERAC